MTRPASLYALCVISAFNAHEKERSRRCAIHPVSPVHHSLASEAALQASRSPAGQRMNGELLEVVPAVDGIDLFAG